MISFVCGTYQQNRNRLTDIENRLVAKGEREGVGCWEFAIVNADYYI